MFSWFKRKSANPANKTEPNNPVLPPSVTAHIIGLDFAAAVAKNLGAYKESVGANPGNKTEPDNPGMPRSLTAFMTGNILAVVIAECLESYLKNIGAGLTTAPATERKNSNLR